MQNFEGVREFILYEILYVSRFHRVNRWLCVGGTTWWLFIFIFIFFWSLFRINGLQNTKEPGIGPWFSYQTRNYCIQKRGEGVMNVSF